MRRYIFQSKRETHERACRLRGPAIEEDPCLAPWAHAMLLRAMAREAQRAPSRYNPKRLESFWPAELV